MYRPGSLTEAARELARYKLDLVGVKEGSLYNILIEFGIPIKMVRLIKMSD
jgi:hypothetical protein